MGDKIEVLEEKGLEEKESVTAEKNQPDKIIINVFYREGHGIDVGFDKESVMLMNPITIRGVFEHAKNMMLAMARIEMVKAEEMKPKIHKPGGNVNSFKNAIFGKRQ